MYDILIADDSAEIRKGLMLKLKWEDYGFRAAAEAADGAEALAVLQERRYPVLITDIRMPVMDGLELLRECAIRFPGTKTIVLSAYDDFPLVQTAIRKGAKDYLLKPVIKTELIAALVSLKRELDAEKERTIAQLSRGELPESEAVSRIRAYGLTEWALAEQPVRFAVAEMRIPEARAPGGAQSGDSFKEAYRLLMTEIASQWGSHVETFGRRSGRIGCFSSFTRIRPLRGMTGTGGKTACSADFWLTSGRRSSGICASSWRSASATPSPVTGIGAPGWLRACSP